MSGQPVASPLPICLNRPTGCGALGKSAPAPDARTHRVSAMKRRSNLPDKPDDVEQVAANGLLHRRALLSRGAAIAGLAGAGLGAAATGAAGDQLGQ